MQSSLQTKWTNDESEILIDPRRIPTGWSCSLSNFPAGLSNIWIATSGTSNAFQIRFIQLKKQSILASAQAVNHWIAATDADVWLRAIPRFHIGGLSIEARAALSGARLIEFDSRWDVQKFNHAVSQSCATLTSLVPTQIFDLVRANVKPAPSLRVVLVGGGRLDQEIFNKALELGWPLLPTFGMTEASSQIATAKLNSHSTALHVMPHIEVSTTVNNQLAIRGDSVLRGICVFEKLGANWQRVSYEEIPENSWYLTSDQVEITSSGMLKPLGRMHDEIKVKGELVNLFRLREIFLRECSIIANRLGENFCLFGVPSAREGFEVSLAIDDRFLDSDLYRELMLTEALSCYNKSVMAHEKIKSVYLVSGLPRNAMGKIEQFKLRDILSFGK